MLAHLDGQLFDNFFGFAHHRAHDALNFTRILLRVGSTRTRAKCEPELCRRANWRVFGCTIFATHAHGTTSQRNNRFDGINYIAGHGARRDRAEINIGATRDGFGNATCHHQSRPLFAQCQPHVAIFRRARERMVISRTQPGDQPQLHYFGCQQIWS